MSIATTAFRVALTAAALSAATWATASTVEARPRRVVILDFDGPRQLADAGRSSVLSVLGDQYDVVATKRWEQARATASQQAHGPAQWAKAAKQSGVDAVIEGWVADEGRRKILNILVRRADNGREFDTISVRIDAARGVSGQNSRQLQTTLDEVLDWINTGQNDPPPGLPTFEVNKLGRSKTPADDPPARLVRRHATIDAESADDADDRDRDRAPARTSSKRRRVADADGGDGAGDDRGVRSSRSTDARDGRDDRDRDGARDRDRDGRDDRARDGARDRDRDGDDVSTAETVHDAKSTEVSTATREVHEIEVLFPPGSEERKDVLGAKADHVPEKTARFQIDAGPYIGSRSLTWDADPDSNVTQFAGVSTKGFQVNAAIYPFPIKQMDGILSGVGFTGSIHHSLGSSVEFDNTDQIEENVINQNGWELGVHYRFPLNHMVALDGGAYYGNQTFEIVDASPEFEVPDTKYSYLGASVHLDLSITDHALVGFGARYFTVLDSGDLASTDWFGPVSASGLGLEGSFQIPLPENLYVRGELSYQRISLETSGGGQITDDEGVTGGTDSVIVGNVNLGIAF
jgi:hypothetical protein